MNKLKSKTKLLEIKYSTGLWILQIEQATTTQEEEEEEEEWATIVSSLPTSS